MGSNHSLSLRLKNNNKWLITLYKFYNKNLLNFIISEHYVIKIINHYFQYILISRPKFEFSTNKILNIKIFYYVPGQKILKRNPNNKNKFLTNSNESLSISIYKLENLLKNYYKIPVKFQLIRLKTPILNSYILGQFIANAIKTYSMTAVIRMILKKTRLKNLEFKNYIKNLKTDLNFNWNKLLKNSLFTKHFNCIITGLKIKVSGRFLKKKGASRTRIKNYSVGSLKFNSMQKTSFIDVGHIERKDKNGSQSIKVHIASQCL